MEMLLGLFWIVVFLGTPIGIGAYVFYRRGGVVGEAQRQADRVVNRAYAESDLIDDAIKRAAWERRNYPGR